MKKHVYTVEAKVLYSAKGHGAVWCKEILNVLSNGCADAAIKKAKAAMLTMKTPDGGSDEKRYSRRATRVDVTSVVQVVEVDLL